MSNAERVQERLGLVIGLSALLHALLLLLSWYALPRLAPLLATLGGSRSKPETQLVTFHFDDVIADVSSSSATDKLPAQALLGRLNSRAADMLPGDADTPVPAGGAPGDNSIPGTGALEDAQGGDAARRTSAKQPPLAPAEPEGLRPGLRDALPSSASQLFTGKRAAAERPGYGARSGEFDEVGALEVGEYAFSTRAWDYEPYWVHMRAKLYRAWNPPVAYTTYGIIQGGWTLVRVVVHRDGTIGGAEILKTDGHQSLHQSSRAAMIGAAPFRPLPADFPDEELVVTVRFIYMPPGAEPPRDAP